MSIIRFGVDGSDVYLYEDCERYINCCFCQLSSESRHLGSVAETLAHVQDHRDAGHHVPSYVDEYLLAEREQLDDWLAGKSEVS